ncbi:cation:proton antiporter [Actinacidiphila sp. bgisy167]|uniref:cation:proton antiporter n=1 Tax=Actinacidiphila sp. bgisy167 TaxID=3413797 RepID=UPI003D72FAFF
MTSSLFTFAHIIAALLLTLLLAHGGRRVAHRLRQPDVIGEISAGLLAGPLLLALVGHNTFDFLLPGHILEALKLLGQGALALYLVGLAHHLRSSARRPGKGAMAWVAIGSLVPSLLAGALLAWWITAYAHPAVRGNAPLAAFVLMTAVSLSISAVPVMARILAARKMQDTPSGALTMAAAVLIDSAGWILLTLALCLNARTAQGLIHCLIALALGGVFMIILRGVLRSRAAQWLLRRRQVMVVFLAVAACGMGYAMEHLGMTSILGAALVGFAVPSGARTPWAPVVDTVSKTGRFLVPVFFVVTGVSVLSRSYGAASWSLLLLTLALGVIGKILGGYAGTRLAGQSPVVAREVGVLMNTRGLTELIVLQAGVSAGILTGPMTLSLVVMALATTAMTGPLLSYLERRRTADDTPPVTVAAFS